MFATPANPAEKHFIVRKQLVLHMLRRLWKLASWGKRPAKQKPPEYPKPVERRANPPNEEIYYKSGPEKPLARKYRFGGKTGADRRKR